MKKNILCSIIIIWISAVASFAQFPFYEAFDDNSKSWSFVGEAGKDYSIQITTGHLAFQSGESPIQTFKYVDFDGTKDFEINARMVFLAGETSELCAVRWGMSADGNQYYVFGYTDKGQYFVGKNDGKMKALANFYPAPSVKPKDYNLLQIKKEGELYLFKINGVQVYQSKKMPWFGGGLALKCPSGSRMMVDYVSITDPVKDKELSSKINDILFAGTTPAKNPPKKTVKQVEVPIVAPPISGSAEFKSFMENFEQMEFSRKIHPSEKKIKGTDITNNPFTKQLFPNLPGQNSIFSVAKVADCADGFILLLTNREKNPQAENTDLILQKVSVAGIPMGSQKIGRLEYMNNRYFLVTDLDFYKQGNTITIEVFRYYDREHKQNTKIQFNQNFCTF